MYEFPEHEQRRYRLHGVAVVRMRDLLQDLPLGPYGLKETVSIDLSALQQIHAVGYAWRPPRWHASSRIVIARENYPGLSRWPVAVGPGAQVLDVSVRPVRAEYGMPRAGRVYALTPR